MKASLDDVLSLLSKYTEESTPVLAVLVTPSRSVTRVLGTIRVSSVEGIPHLLIGKADEQSDLIKFRLSNCEFSYAEFRDAKAASEDSAAHKFECVLCVGSSKGDTLSLFEPKN
jgi:hypothetical protein